MFESNSEGKWQIICISSEKEIWEEYVVFLKRILPVNYKMLYEKFKYKGLLKGKENILTELRNRYEEGKKDKFDDSYYNSSNDAKMFPNEIKNLSIKISKQIKIPLNPPKLTMER